MENKYTSLIERYFDDQLSEKELAEFNQLKSSDVEFQNELALFEKAQMVVELDALSQLKEQARKLDKGVSIQPKKSSFNWMKIAASIAIIGVAGIVFYAQNNFSNNGLYENAFTQAPDYVSDLGSEKTDLSEAMELYNKEEYQKASEAFTMIADREPSNTIAHFYWGQCEMKLENWSGAIEAFTYAKEDYQSEAQWYIALAYLKLGEVENSLAVLEFIIIKNQDQAFVLKAQNLKEKLNSPLRSIVW